MKKLVNSKKEAPRSTKEKASSLHSNFIFQYSRVALNVPTRDVFDCLDIVVPLDKVVHRDRGVQKNEIYVELHGIFEKYSLSFDKSPKPAFSSEELHPAAIFSSSIFPCNKQVYVPYELNENNHK